VSDPRQGTVPVTAGPTISFAFNFQKIPEHGEDSDPILRDGPDLGLLGVFDGMGGAGGTVYETPAGPRSGAYLGSRIARDVVETRMVQLLVPDWNLKGGAAAADLRRAVQDALQSAVADLNAPPSRLKSRLLRSLPTTMAVLGLQRARRDGATWTCHAFWAGDSRAYVVTADGAQQLTLDDLRDPGDALANLRHDSVVSNALSADVDFAVRYRRVELEAPFLLVVATDGCFGYLPSPMHFERLLLETLGSARSVEGWSEAVQREIAAVTGDDASMAVLGVGADLADFKRLLAPRLRALEEEYVRPVDELAAAVQRAEQDLTALRRQQQDDLVARWTCYKAGYEQHLHAPSAPEPEPEPGEEAGADPESAAREPESLPAARGFGPDPRREAPTDAYPEPEPAAAEEASG
jgi:serine/threonine protein phosphatase PrpC